LGSKKKGGTAQPIHMRFTYASTSADHFCICFSYLLVLHTIFISFPLGHGLARHFFSFLHSYRICCRPSEGIRTKDFPTARIFEDEAREEVPPAEAPWN
jgi:hypothetical protein